jgi:hypothetical protein
LSVTVLDPPYFGPDGALRQTARPRSTGTA